MSTQKLFDRQSNIPAANLSAVWGHSLLVAEVARSVAVATRSSHPDEAYLAALLHDVGELILLAALGAP
ncbi:HDOD domain-containing protein [Dechloromonas sp.]|uniref:HDOD domain-containing protein n=1 Tax=Dechloromonas sp. TaxID=1917218 RepID=UPI0034602B92